MDTGEKRIDPKTRTSGRASRWGKAMTAKVGSFNCSAWAVRILATAPNGRPSMRMG
ncbi:MAG: hypothetical protein V4812_04725 [Pseudomonadota bacterium]